MGALQFAKNGNYKRFYDNLKVIGKKEHKSPKLMFADAALCVLVTGSGLSDYINYEFYNKSWKERKTYITIGYQADFYKTAGLDPDKLLHNKINFLKNNPDLTKRDFYSTDQGIEALDKFLKKHKDFVIKPVNGLGGTDVKKMNVSEVESLEDFYNYIDSNNMFLEELIITPLPS